MSLTSRHPLRVKFTTAEARSYMGHATRTAALSGELTSDDGRGGSPGRKARSSWRSPSASRRPSPTPAAAPRPRYVMVGGPGVPTDPSW